jgi:hypothetical protein
MTDLTAREVVEKLHQYDDLPSFPKINIHFLATAPGNEHLLKFMTEKPDNPIRFKGKRIGIIATPWCRRNRSFDSAEMVRGAGRHLPSRLAQPHRISAGIRHPVPRDSINRDCSAIAGCRKRRVRVCVETLSDLLPPSPPTEKAAGRQDQAGQASTGDGARNGGRQMEL